MIETEQRKDFSTGYFRSFVSEYEYLCSSCTKCELNLEFEIYDSEKRTNTGAKCAKLLKICFPLNIDCCVQPFDICLGLMHIKHKMFKLYKSISHNTKHKT